LKKGPEADDDGFAKLRQIGKAARRFVEKPGQRHNQRPQDEGGGKYGDQKRF
jgi:hypothetical protein